MLSSSCPVRPWLVPAWIRGQETCGRGSVTPRERPSGESEDTGAPSQGAGRQDDRAGQAERRVTGPLAGSTQACPAGSWRVAWGPGGVERSLLDFDAL